jgi:hypothetical protein
MANFAAHFYGRVDLDPIRGIRYKPASIVPRHLLNSSADQGF